MWANLTNMLLWKSNCTNQPYFQNQTMWGLPHRCALLKIKLYRNNLISKIILIWAHVRTEEAIIMQFDFQDNLMWFCPTLKIILMWTLHIKRKAIIVQSDFQIIFMGSPHKCSILKIKLHQIKLVFRINQIDALNLLFLNYWSNNAPNYESW